MIEVGSYYRYDTTVLKILKSLPTHSSLVIEYMHLNIISTMSKSYLLKFYTKLTPLEMELL